MQLADEVMAVFKQAAGVQAPQILARLANFGVQGRAEALDKDLFSAPSMGAHAVLSFWRLSDARQNCQLISGGSAVLVTCRTALVAPQDATYSKCANSSKCT
jgi:hypothetical protein